MIDRLRMVLLTAARHPHQAWGKTHTRHINQKSTQNLSHYSEEGEEVDDGIRDTAAGIWALARCTFPMGGVSSGCCVR